MSIQLIHTQASVLVSKNFSKILTTSHLHLRESETPPARRRSAPSLSQRAGHNHLLVIGARHNPSRHTPRTVSQSVRQSVCTTGGERAGAI